MKDKTNTHLMIRIRNDTPATIENFWLGAGPRGGATQETVYSSIAAGETSDYQAVEARLDNYRKMNMVIAGKRYLGLIDPAEQVGSPELAPGWYTFAYMLVADAPVLTIVRENAP